MKTISLRIPAELHAKLNALARRRKVRKSQLMREALEAYVNGSTGGVEGLSAYDAAPHLSGCLHSGEGDLATNKKHMEGFGS